MARIRLMRSPRAVYYRALRRVERRSAWAIATHSPRDMALLVEACRLANRLALIDAAPPAMPVGRAS